MSDTASTSRSPVASGVGCALVLLPIVAAVAAVQATRPRTVLGWGLVLEALRWAVAAGAGLAVLVVVVLAVGQLTATRPAPAAGTAPEPDFTPTSARVARWMSGAVAVALAAWIVGALWAFGIAYGVVRYVNDRDAGPAQRASCTVLHRGTKRDRVTCVLPTGAPVDAAIYETHALPRGGDLFRARLYRGGLGAWLLDTTSIRAEAPPAAPR